jgi:N-acetylglutamate synthase-like GNAT family acetyltransferase
MKFYLRPATQDDERTIRALIRQVRINPMGLGWQRFIVAVDPSGKMIGCGQIKHHKDGSRELASIAVVESFRNQGIATAIINQLITSSPLPIYLTCRSNLGRFYGKFGFSEIRGDLMPPYFKRINKIASLLSRLSHSDQLLLVMVYSDQPH